MKKTILVSIAVLAIAAMAAFNVNFNSQSEDFSGVSLANVEALAQESGNVRKLNCWQTVENCPNDSTLSTHKTYCGSCGPMLVKKWSNSSTC